MRINRAALMHCWLLVLVALLPGGAHAANYTFYWNGFLIFGEYKTNTPCTGSWSYSSDTFRCTGSVNLAPGDTLRVDTILLGNITVVADSGFTLSGNSVGTSSKNITLSAGYSPLTATGTNVINGSVRASSGSISLASTTVNGSVESASGAITLANSSISGTLTSSGNTELTNSSVAGATRITNDLTATTGNFTGNVTVSGASSFTGGNLAASLIGGGSVTTANGTTINGNLSNNYGAVSLDGGRVGSINAAQDVSTSNGTTVTGALTASGDVTLGSRSSIGGKVNARNVIANETTFSGDITVTAGLVKLTGGSVTGNIGSNCCTITLNQVQVTGNVTTSQNNIVLDGSTVTGNLVTTHRIQLLNDSFVYGDVTAATWDNSTIYGTGSSHVYGVCAPSATNPDDLCDGVIVPTCLIKDKDKADNFDRSVLGSDWAVTSRNGDFGEPRIVGGRLRLTDDSPEVSTGATIQRTFPAANNLITVTFKYYGYSKKSTRGADGIALILSDARVTPQPGAFGGSLGYAQKTGISGFAGGWLGIGFDEFGNYSNESEGRIGGVGSRSDTIAIRGSENSSSPYRYLTGVGAGEIDNRNSTTEASPGHLYRVTIDSRERGKTLVTVERDTRGNGRNYETLISAYDVQAHSSQASVPENFWLSFTGSTGSYVNNHELDELQVCANRMDPVGTQIDHFEIIAPSSGLTCSPVPVSVKACLDSACTLYTEAVTAKAVLSSGGSIINSDTQTFTGGTGSFSLRRTTEGSATLGIAGSNPATKPLSETRCKIGEASLSLNCSLMVYSSGFLVDVPDFISGDSVRATITAVKADEDDPQACSPAFGQAGPRSLKIWSSYIDPDPSREVGHGSVTIAGAAVSTLNNSQTNTYDLTFNDAAVAYLDDLSYADAGKMALYASYSGEEGSPEEGLTMVSMKGEGLFIATPASFKVETASGACDPEKPFDGENCVAFKAAGDSFDLRISAVNLQGEPTPNFEHAVSLAVSDEGDEKYYPRDGVLPKIYPEKYEHSLGNVNLFYDLDGGPVPRVVDVGVVKLLASAEDYLKPGNTVVGLSGWVRFIPAWLEVSGAATLASCDGFSYQRELVSYGVFPQLTVTGKNRQGDTTKNYDRGAFWRLPSTLPNTWWALDGVRELTNNLNFPGQDSTLNDAEGPDGQRTYEWSGDGLKYDSTSTTPDADDLPFSILQRFSAAALTDVDGACHMAGTEACQLYELPYEDSEIRLGRLRIANAHGSERLPLALSWMIESWQAPGVFLPEEGDICSAPTWSEPDLIEPTGDLAAITAPEVSTIKAGHQGVLTVAAPKVTGSGRVGFPGVREWLWYDWRGEGKEPSRGLATFGIYQGPKPLIFRREVYR